jgi:protoporphyrinogen oxidase
LRNALFKGKKNKITTLVEEFRYPRFGCGMMYEAVADRVRSSGGSIRLNSEVMEIRHDRNRITGLVCRDAREGSLSEIEGTDFCSSMPLNLLVSRMNPRPEAEILKMCSHLRYRSLLVVYLILESKDLFKDNWIYIHSSDLKVGRIASYKNWSPDMVPYPDRTSLSLEYFCTEGDSTWSLSDEAAIGVAVGELEKLKLINRRDIVVDAFLLRVPNAYPVYEKGYLDAVEVVKNYIHGFKNLQCIGRYGIFRYNNMDHSVLTGFLAAENVLGRNHNLWDVNLEQSYHEELEDEELLK